ncbi:MAG: hypothetical protein IPL58_03615 [Betaproteobacteria bacterium]|uniref:Uncharacterized protein n=1 Tax=Candidatus Proximibacter danicus TaxID=2954365 RepID=A0A9D7JZ07_9PROT|nr:hypothetical protein [Candidatus Proximibacter danicus]
MLKKVVDELRVQHTWATFLPSLVRAIFEFSSIVALCFILVFGYQHLEIAAASMLVVLALFDATAAAIQCVAAEHAVTS